MVGVVSGGTLVMVEHILKNCGAGQSGAAPRSPLESIRPAALEIERPIFFSLVVPIAAYLPLFTLERMERRLFTPMAFTVCCSALLGSMLSRGLSGYFFKYQILAVGSVFK